MWNVSPLGSAGYLRHLQKIKRIDELGLCRNARKRSLRLKYRRSAQRGEAKRKERQSTEKIATEDRA